MLVVGISDMQISRDPGEMLITYSLSSCIGLVMYDPVNKIGGMLHSMLPISKIDEKKARENPFMFTDTGVVNLLQTLFDMGVRRKDLIVKVAGAATLLDEKGLFRIGERNYTVLRKILWKNNILIESENIGGNTPRTLSLYINTGRTTVRIGGKEVDL
jgi:chemotaxis protein CheD